nr:retrovirus-related Pol polyprotein from transposon TNT 1-94 [Tanacetum cinerariifolium]
TSTDEESIKSYYHRFMQLINDLKRNKHFSKNIASNLKFLNNLQPEWKRHFTIVRQTKNLHEADFTQIYNFLKMYQEEVNELRAKRLVKSHDPVALIAYSQNLFNFPITHKDQSSSSTHLQQSFPINNKYNPQPPLNQKFMQPLMNSLEDINDLTEAKNTALIIFAKAFQLSAPTNNNQRTSSNPRNHQIAQSVMNIGIAIQNGTGNVVAAKVEGTGNGNQASRHPHLVLSMTGLPSMTQMAQLRYILMTTATIMRYSICSLRKSSIRIYLSPFLNYIYCHRMTTKSKEELFLSNVSNMVTVSKMISIPNEDLSDDTTPSVARKFLDARVQNFEIQFLQKAAKFVRDFKSLAKEADESLDKQKSLELKIERLLKASVSHDIMSIVQNSLVDVPFDLRTELDPQLRDLKGKSSNTLSVSNTLDPLNQKLKSKIVELEFQVVNYEREISHLKTTYKNLFDSIKSNRAHAKLHDLIFENAKLRARLFEKTFESVKNTSGTSVTSHCDKPKLSVVTPLSKMLHASMTSHSVPQPREFNVMKHRNLIAPRMFKINPSQTPRENVNSYTATASSKGLVHTARTIRLQPKGNTRNARVPSASKSSEVKKIVTVEDHRRTLLLSNNQKTMSSECNNIKLAIRNDKSEIICDTCKQCLVTTNHDACLNPFVTVLNSCANKMYANVSRSANQKKHMTQVVQICLWCVDSGCSKHMTGNIKLLINFVWKFLGTVRFGNYHIAAILGYGDLKWGNVTITRVYFVEGLGHNLFSVGQFCDADLEVAFRRNTCFIRDLDGVNLLKGNRSTNLYTINLHKMTSASPICLMARPTPTKSTKDETPEVIKNFLKKIYVRLQAPVIIQKGVVERRNRTLAEAARTMLIFSYTPLFLRAKAIATVCYAQNRSIIHRRFNKTPYELIQGRKPDISYLHVFEALCYLKNDREDIGKLDAKGNVGFFIRYSANFVAYRVYNWRTRKIMETMNVMFDELSAMDFEQNSSRPRLQKAPRAIPTVYVLQNLRTPTASMYFQDFAPINQSPSGIFINQSKYVHEILKKYGLNTSDIVGTLMDIKDKLDLDQIRTPVDATKYHSMIGALMFLTSSGPDMYMLLVYVLDTKLNPPKSTSKRLKGSFAIFEEPLIWVSVTMEILLEPTLNKLLIGDVGDSIWIKLVTLDIDLGPE